MRSPVYERYLISRSPLGRSYRETYRVEARPSGTESVPGPEAKANAAISAEGLLHKDPYVTRTYEATDLSQSESIGFDCCSEQRSEENCSRELHGEDIPGTEAGRWASEGLVPLPSSEPFMRERSVLALHRHGELRNMI